MVEKSQVRMMSWPCGRTSIGNTRSNRSLPASSQLLAICGVSDDVAHVAELARLRLADDELDTFTAQLGAILDHAADVEALDLAGVEPTSHPIELGDVVRPDEPGATLSPDEALAAAPAAEDGRFRVPTILGEEP